MRLFGIGLMLSVMVLSAPIAWAQGPGRGGTGRGGFGGGAMLLSQKSVQEELKLSEEQVKKVDELLAKQREAFGSSRDLSREERQKQFAESRAAGQKAVSEILNEEQQKRYKQISLQLQGPGALGDPEVASAIGLSDEQKKNVEEIQTAAREEMRALFEAGGGDREKFRAARDATNEKLQAVLTDEQKSKWKELTGEPFKGELQGQRRRRSRDGADTSATTTNVLTADKSEEKSDGDRDSGKNADKKRDKEKQRDNGDAKERKGDGKKQAGKHKKPHGKHAQANRRRHGDRSEQAARHGHQGGRGEVAAHRAPHARRGHGPQNAGFRHARDPRAEAWSRVARAVSHRQGPHRWAHARGPRPVAHRHGGPPHFAGQQFARHQFADRHFGHRDFAPRYFGRHHSRPEFARHEFARRGDFGPRQFAGFRGPRPHHGPRPEFAHRGTRHGGPGRQHAHHLHHRGPRPDVHFFAERRPSRGPGHHVRAESGPDGPRFQHVVEGPRHHGPHAAHDRAHGPWHPAHFAGFRRGDDRAHGAHRRDTKGDGDRDHGKQRDAEGERARKAANAPPADDRDRQRKKDND